MLLPEISKMKEKANSNELAAIEAFTRVWERMENETKFTLKPELKEVNDVIKHHVNVFACQISPVLQQIRSEIYQLNKMVEKSEEKYGKMIKDAVADIGAQAAQMFLLQDTNFHTWTVDIVKQLDKRFNNVDFKVETDIVISKLVLQKADAITVSQDFIRSDQNETMKQLDEQLKYMQMFNPQAGAGDLIRTADGLEEFTDNIDSGPKHDDQHSKKQEKTNQNTTLQTNANPGPANTPAKNKKNASNEEKIPGTEKHAAAKNKEFHEKKTSNFYQEVGLID